MEHAEEGKLNVQQISFTGFTAGALSPSPDLPPADAGRKPGEFILAVTGGPDLLRRNVQRVGNQFFTFGPVPVKRI